MNQACVGSGSPLAELGGAGLADHVEPGDVRRRAAPVGHDQAHELGELGPGGRIERPGRAVARLVGQQHRACATCRRGRRPPPSPCAAGSPSPGPGRWRRRPARPRSPAPGTTHRASWARASSRRRSRRWRRRRRAPSREAPPAAPIIAVLHESAKARANGIVPAAPPSKFRNRRPSTSSSPGHSTGRGRLEAVGEEGVGGHDLERGPRRVGAADRPVERLVERSGDRRHAPRRWRRRRPPARRARPRRRAPARPPAGRRGRASSAAARGPPPGTSPAPRRSRRRRRARRTSTAGPPGELLLVLRLEPVEPDEIADGVGRAELLEPLGGDLAVATDEVAGEVAGQAAAAAGVARERDPEDREDHVADLLELLGGELGDLHEVIGLDPGLVERLLDGGRVELELLRRGSGSTPARSNRRGSMPMRTRSTSPTTCRPSAPRIGARAAHVVVRVIDPPGWSSGCIAVSLQATRQPTSSTSTSGSSPSQDTSPMSPSVNVAVNRARPSSPSSSISPSSIAVAVAPRSVPMATGSRASTVAGLGDERPQRLAVTRGPRRRERLGRALRPLLVLAEDDDGVPGETSRPRPRQRRG